MVSISSSQLCWGPIATTGILWAASAILTFEQLPIEPELMKGQKRQFPIPEDSSDLHFPMVRAYTAPISIQNLVLK